MEPRDPVSGKCKKDENKRQAEALGSASYQGLFFVGIMSKAIEFWRLNRCNLTEKRVFLSFAPAR